MSSYIDHRAGGRYGRGLAPNEVIHDWRYHTYENLAWHYGTSRAYAILAGNDSATQSDLARWNALGRRSAA